MSPAKCLYHERTSFEIGFWILLGHKIVIDMMLVSFYKSDNNKLLG